MRDNVSTETTTRAFRSLYCSKDCMRISHLLAISPEKIRKCDTVVLQAVLDQLGEENRSYFLEGTSGAIVI